MSPGPDTHGTNTRSESSAGIAESPDIVRRSHVSRGVRPYALDPEMAKALWAKSEKLAGERF